MRNTCALTVGLTASLLVWSTSSAAAPRSQCSIEVLTTNLQQKPDAIPLAPEFLVMSPVQGKNISQEKRVPCMMADLLQLGFEYRGGERYGPAESTNRGYEAVHVFQRGPLLVRCYTEFTLDKEGPDARMASSRAACQQVVPIRLSGS